MIPTLIQRRGAQHLAEEEAAQAPVDRAALNPPREVLALVPAVVARENNVLPLRLEGPVLYVATADASDILLRDKLSFVLNRDIRLIEYPRSDIVRAVRQFYGETKTESGASRLKGIRDQREIFETDFEIPPMPEASYSEAVALEADTDLEESEFELTLGKLARAPTRAQKSLARALSYYAGAPRPESRPFNSPYPQPGEDTTPDYGTRSMFHYTVEEGQRALMIRKDGRMEVIVGPGRVWSWGKRFEKMRHFVAHPGDFLVVRYRDGRQEHIAGPADVWFDPRIHEGITRQEALQLAAKEAVVVYSRAAENQPITRRLVYGPTLFVPAPGEWLHTFSWHGSDGGSTGVRKVAKGLVFQKLWLMPDQMYHDVTDVRTADDAVLTVKLMMFFELLDIERMLETTHDPIGDFINAATSDVVDFIGHRTFEEFKKETGKLNELETYRQLTARAAQNGYRVNKVVYRGYDAPARLQAMHDQAIEARTKLQLERATEEQSQSLEDFKLNAQMKRATSRRTEQTIEVDTEIELARKRHEAERQQKEAERTVAREQRRRDAETEQEIRRQTDERQRQHLAVLKEMGVDLTALLTQGRADRVIELRGGKGVSPHLHLDGAESNGET
jgi:hypothetical protein